MELVRKYTLFSHNFYTSVIKDIFD